MYENMNKVLNEMDFVGWIRLWDLVEAYVINGRPIEKIRDDFKKVFKIYKEIVIN